PGTAAFMKRPPFPPSPCEPEAHAVLARVSPGYPPHQVRLLTCYAPVRRSARHPKAPSSLDLHVLGTPPAFVLSQDQTLQRKSEHAHLNASTIRRRSESTLVPTQSPGEVVPPGRGPSEPIEPRFSNSLKPPATRSEASLGKLTRIRCRVNPRPGASVLECAA